MVVGIWMCEDIVDASLGLQGKHSEVVQSVRVLGTKGQVATQEKASQKLLAVLLDPRSTQARPTAG